MKTIRSDPLVLTSEQSSFHYRRLKKNILLSVLTMKRTPWEPRIWKIIPIEAMLEEDDLLLAAISSDPTILSDTRYCHLQKEEHFALQAAKYLPVRALAEDVSLSRILSHRKVVLFLISTDKLFWFDWKYYWPRITTNFPQYMCDKEIVLAAVTKYSDFFQDCELKDDNDVVVAAVRESSSCFKYASERLRGDVEVVTIASRSEPSDIILQFASDQGKSNADVVLAAVTVNGRNLRYASEAVRDIERVVIAAISNYPRALVFAGLSQRRNTTVLKAMSDPAWVWDLGLCPAEWNQGEKPLKMYIIDILHRIDARGHFWLKYSLDDSHNPTRLPISAQIWIRYAWEKIFVLGHIRGLGEITHLRRDLLNFVPELRFDIQNFEELRLCEDIINMIISRGSPKFLARLRLEVYPMYTHGGSIQIRNNYW